MSGPEQDTSSQNATPVPVSTSWRRSSSPAAGSPAARHASIARLASPVPSPSNTGTPFSPRHVPVSNPSVTASGQDLGKVDDLSSLPGPRQSSLASALRDDAGRASPKPGTSPKRTASPALVAALGKPVKTNYGSFDPNNGRPGSVHSGVAPYEDPEIVKRHLVQPPNASEALESNVPAEPTDNLADDEFSSLRLQGGDITRQVYRWAEAADAEAAGRQPLRSKSFSLSRPQPEDETTDIHSIRVPGGFRRDYIRRTAGSPRPSSAHGSRVPIQPQIPTSSFLEFLTLYGHFAGEELEEDDEVLAPDEYFSSDVWDDSDGRAPGEESALLGPGTPGLKKRKHKPRGGTGTNTRTGAALLLLKSFVGTGVLFLPRAFMNGGMLFSSLVLLGVSILSFYAFILLVNTRLRVEGSFGDIGGILYGKYMRNIILASIVISQLGFVSAYIVFTAENLQAFVLAISKCKSFIDIKFMVLMQLVVFVPLSLIRDISKLGFTALIADFFILLGLIYLFYYDIGTIAAQGGVADIKAFNPSTWTLFIGTAIFTYEGIGLIIPIQESMKHPRKFAGVLAGVMVLITVVFLSAGALGYAAYGSATKTVVILNLPQDNKFVNGIQFLYSLAILLSTPLQLFPAIRIMENGLFTRSGKYNPGIKWKKNFFRFCLVMFCAFVAWGGAEDLDKFVSLIGSFACVPLIYVYPPLLHYKACARSRKQQIADLLLACFGVVCCVYTTALTISNWVSNSGVKSPGYCDT